MTHDPVDFAEERDFFILHHQHTCALSLDRQRSKASKRFRSQNLCPHPDVVALIVEVRTELNLSDFADSVSKSIYYWFLPINVRYLMDLSPHI